MKKINDYEIIDHGVDSCDFLQGCGIANTQYEDIATGIGDSSKDAMDDALEQLAQNGWDTDSDENLTKEFKYSSDSRTIPEEEYGEDNSCLYHYVSIRVK